MKRALTLLLAAAALAGAAGGLPSPALLAPAAGLVLVTAAAWATVTVAAGRLSVSRYVLTRETVEDTPVAVRFDVRGLGRLPVRLEAQVGGRSWVPLGPGAAKLAFTIGRRGSYRVGPSPLRLRDALGIVERRLDAGRPEPLLVLPRPDAGALAARRPWAGAPEDGDVDGLTPYAPGTPIGRIHWPTLARGAGLHARHIATGPGGLPLVVVEAGVKAGAAAVDWAARVSAGHILGLARTGGCRVLLPGDRRATTVSDTLAQWRTVHRRLALMQPSAHGAPPVPLAELGPGAVRIDATRAPAGAAREAPPPLPPEVEPAPVMT